MYILQRMWNGGITNIGSRGRGSSVDRGRGRTGRGGLYSSHYSRGVGFGDDSGDGIRIEGQSFQVHISVFFLLDFLFDVYNFFSLI